MSGGSSEWRRESERGRKNGRLETLEEAVDGVSEGRRGRRRRKVAGGELEMVVRTGW